MIKVKFMHSVDSANNKLVFTKDFTNENEYQAWLDQAKHFGYRILEVERAGASVLNRIYG